MPTIKTLLTGIAVAIPLALAPLLVQADDEAPSADQIAKWITALASDSFQERQDATNALGRAGAPAAQALAAAAEKSFDLEVPTRCVNILGKMARSGDDETQKAARAALETLTKSERKFLARRATETLKGPEEEAVQGVPGVIGGNIRIQVGGIGGANNVRIQSKTVNGQRETNVEADGKTIVITDTNGKNIAMKVTEKVNGRDVTTEYKADDLADLKQKSPEAAKLYEQYANGGVNIAPRAIGGIQILPGGRIQIAPGQVLPGGVQRQRVRMPFVPRQQVDGAVEKLEKSLEELKQLAKDGKVPEGALDDVIKRLAEARGELEEAP